MNEIPNDKFILQSFNEIHPCHFWSDFVSTGPIHMPTFEVNLYVNDAVFSGHGSSKKKAKINAVKNFTRSNTEINFSMVRDDVMQNRKRKITENSIQQPASLKKEMTNTNCDTTLNNFMEHCSPLKLQVMESTSNTVVPQKSPISILHEMFPAQILPYEFEGLGGMLVAVSVHVSGNKYTGIGCNKKEAKDLACRYALIALYEKNLLNNSNYQDEIEMLRPQNHVDKIINCFVYITGTMHQKLEIENNKIKEYSVIASIIKVNL